MLASNFLHQIPRMHSQTIIIHRDEPKNAQSIVLEYLRFAASDLKMLTETDLMTVHHLYLQKLSQRKA